MNNSRKLADLPETRNVDAMLLTTPENRFYATGFRSSAGVAVITRKSITFSPISVTLISSTGDREF